MIQSFTELLSFGFMRRALLAGILAGGLLGYLGLFVILRRIVFLGAALPQFAAAGAALSLILGTQPVVGALAGALGGVGIISLFSSGHRIPEDGVIGLAYAFASTGAILLLSAAARGQSHLLSVLSGDILGSTTWDLVLLGTGTIIIVLLHVGFWKELLLTAYDEEGALAFGYSVTLWNLVLYLSLGGAVALSLKLSGAVVTFSLLTGPAATGLLLFRRFRWIIPTTAATGVIAAVLGLTVSYHFDLPGGPTIAAFSLIPVLPAGLTSYVTNNS